MQEINNYVIIALRIWRVGSSDLSKYQFVLLNMREFCRRHFQIRFLKQEYLSWPRFHLKLSQWTNDGVGYQHIHASHDRNELI